MRSKGFLRFMRFFLVALLTLLTATGAWPVSYKVMHAFDGRRAARPLSGLVADNAGNLYGTTSGGGHFGGYGGTVYQLSSATGLTIIHAFGSLPDGLHPEGNLAIDSAGNLYGTTLAGGTSKQCQYGCGTVFELTPPSAEGEWTETILYNFCSASNCTDGAHPTAGVILDAAGNLYGTTEQGGVGGPSGCGTVFSLEPGAGVWTETVLYEVTDGCKPESGLVLDGLGNVYGTVFSDGPQVAGRVFELSPQLAGNWIYTPIYAFDGFPRFEDGGGPLGGLIFDALGSLFGTTVGGGKFGLGVVFKLTPDPNGEWTEKILHNFAGGNDGARPEANLVFDAAGNLYGTTSAGGSTGQFCDPPGEGCGTVFELTPNGNGRWTQQVFRFPGDLSLAAQPTTPLLLDGTGHAYGTASLGGSKGAGVVFRFTQ